MPVVTKKRIRLALRIVSFPFFSWVIPTVQGLSRDAIDYFSALPAIIVAVIVSVNGHPTIFSGAITFLVVVNISYFICRFVWKRSLGFIRFLIDIWKKIPEDIEKEKPKRKFVAMGDNDSEVILIDEEKNFKRS